MEIHKLGFFRILLEPNKIIHTFYRHFLTLYILFLLPFSISIIAFPKLQSSLVTNSDSTTFKSLVLPLLYAFIPLTLYLCATASITYSFYHAYFGRPIKLIYTIRSLHSSFFRLLATFICALTIVFGVGIFLFGVIRCFECLGLETEHRSYVLILVLGLELFYLYLNWILAPVIVIVESRWGFEALWRSAYLVKGRRGVIVCLVLFMVLGLGLPLSNSWALGSSRLSSTMIVVSIVSSLGLLAFVNLPCILTTVTMMYIDCKAWHGEFDGDSIDMFAGEYGSLPLDDFKVIQFVSVVQP